MTEIILMVLAIETGSDMRIQVPAPSCAAVQREWHLCGGRLYALDRTTGIRHTIREVRCEVVRDVPAP